jgi:hypothetical protein
MLRLVAFFRDREDTHEDISRSDILKLNLLLLLLTATELSLVGITDETNKKTYIKETTQKSTNNTKHSKYKLAYYQN